VSKYIFQSERLGFRNWTVEDLHPFSQMNMDKDVMEFFPNKLTFNQTKIFLNRLKNEFIQNGFTFYVVEIMENLLDLLVLKKQTLTLLPIPSILFIKSIIFSSVKYNIFPFFIISPFSYCRANSFLVCHKIKVNRYLICHHSVFMS